MDAETLNKYSGPIVDAYTELEEELLVNMAASLKGTDTLLATDPVAWQLQQMQNLNMLNQDNLKLIKHNAQLTSPQLNGILYGAGLEGLEQTEEAIAAATKKGAHLAKPVPIVQSMAIYNMLQSYENQAKSIFNLTNAALLKNSSHMYKQTINATALKVISGTMSSDAALRATIRQWNDDGIPALINKKGHKIGTEGYVRTVLNTTVNNTVEDLQTRRLNDYGVSTVEISSHAGNRPGCQPYAGKVFSTKPNHPEYQYLYDPAVGRIGAADSLFGINCGHIKYPFFEGLSERTYSPPDKTKDDKIYKESQQQRLLERRIMGAKRQRRMFEAAGDSKGVAQADKLILARQASMRKFINDTSRTRRRGREQLVTGSAGEVKKLKKFKPMPKPSPVKPMPLPKKPVNPPATAIKKELNVKTLPDGTKMHEMAYTNIGDVTPTIYNFTALNVANKEALETMVDYTSLQQLKVAYKLDKNSISPDMVMLYEKIIKDLENSKVKPKPLPDPKAVATVNNKKVESKFESIYPQEQSFFIKGISDSEMVEYKMPKSGINLDFFDDLQKAKTPFKMEEVILDYEMFATPEALEAARAYIIQQKKLATYRLKNVPEGNIKPIDLSIFEEINSSDSMVGQHKDFIKKLDKQERDAIRLYTSNSYTEINNALRAGKEVTSHHWGSINMLKMMLDDSPALTKNITVARGISSRAYAPLFGDEVADALNNALGGSSSSLSFLQKKLDGAVIQDPAFLSTSYRKGTWSGSMQMNIHLPKGYDKGMFVESVSEFSSEKEYLMQAGTKFKVINVDVTDGTIYLDVTPIID